MTRHPERHPHPGLRPQAQPFPPPAPGLHRPLSPRRLPPPTRDRGIALPAMVFMLVVLGLLLSTGLSLLMGSQQSQTQQLMSARASAAARSALEWGLWQVSDPNATGGLPAGVTPACFASQTLTLPAPLEAFTVQVSCTRTPGTGEVDDGGLKLASYAIVAVASYGSTGTVDHVRRQMEARHTVCRNPGGDAPGYRC
jgi:Tfp pilus assembly protein PilX